MKDLYGYRYSRSYLRGGSVIAAGPPTPLPPVTVAILVWTTVGNEFEDPFGVEEVRRGSMRQTLPEREEFRNNSPSTGCEAGEG
jgi:hypothetical protein